MRDATRVYTTRCDMVPPFRTGSEATNQMASAKKQVAESAFEFLLIECVAALHRQFKGKEQLLPERLDELGFHVGERFAERCDHDSTARPTHTIFMRSPALYFHFVSQSCS